MATSWSNSSTLSGYAGTAVQINTSVSSQSTSGNYTIIAYSVKLVGQYAGSYMASSWANWNAQNPSGTSFTSGSYGYVTVSNTSSVTLKSGTKTIYHNADGTKSTSFSGYCDTYAGSATAGTGTMTLPIIPRYASITSFTVTNPTDSSLKFNVSANATCDVLQYSTNNGSSYTTVNGDFTSKSVTVTGLASGTTFNCKVKVRRKDSGLYTTSGTVNGTTYTYLATFVYDNTNPYADGALYKDSGSGAVAVSGSDLYFKTYSAEGNTTVPHTGDDPSDILKAILDNFTDNGGSVTYDGSSIDDTGTAVSYTFVGQSCFEAINSVLALAPENWYYYIDNSTNLLHFHEKGNTADHKFTIGKDVSAIAFEKRSEDIINTVYFTGGDTGGGAILYKKYENASSIAQHGIRAKRIIDGRVLDPDTAETMSNRILNTYASPEVRLKVSITDDSVSVGGYDIEEIEVGDIVRVTNDQNNTGTSLWNEMVWNVDKWNYDITQLGTLYLQIVRLEYQPDEAVFTCSSIPPQVNKRIQDIERNLEASQVLGNDDAPS